MIKFKLKALAAALATTFLLGSGVVMADTSKTIAQGYYLLPGDTVTVSESDYYILLESDDDPRGQDIGLYSGTYTMGDEFIWDEDYNQWMLPIISSRGSIEFFYFGYNWATGNEHPVALKCTGGDGSLEYPFTFDLVFNEDLAIPHGTVIYIGDTFTMNSDAYIHRDDYPTASNPIDLLRAGQYSLNDLRWVSRWGQWGMYIDPVSGSSGQSMYIYRGYNGSQAEADVPAAIMITGGVGGFPSDALEFELVNPMYRLYNPNSGEHFYTANPAERSNLISLGWNDEGIGWYAPAHSNTPVYRLYNPNAGEHHYTTDVAERENLISLGWNDEGIGWYSDDQERVPLYRQYNPNEFANNHNYTTSLAENDWLVSLGWRAEGTGWYGVGCSCF